MDLFFVQGFSFFGLPEKFGFCGLRPFVSSQSICDLLQAALVSMDENRMTSDNNYS